MAKRRGRHGPSFRARAAAGYAPPPRTEPRAPVPWSIAAYRRAREWGVRAVYVRKEEIIVRDRGVCYLCGEVAEPKDIVVDHIVPLSRGGSHTPGNLGVAHAYCNARKGSGLTDKRPASLAPAEPQG